MTACQVEGLELWDDPHNTDPAFTRVRVRRRVLPVLEDELGPGVAAHPGPHRRPAARRHGPARRRSPPRVARRASAGDGLAVDALAGAARRRCVAGCCALAALAAGAPAAELFHEHVLAVDALLDRLARPEVDRPPRPPARRTPRRPARLRARSVRALRLATDFHSPEWKFTPADVAGRSTAAFPRVRVEIHRRPSERPDRRPVDNVRARDPGTLRHAPPSPFDPREPSRFRRAPSTAASSTRRLPALLHGVIVAAEVRIGRARVKAALACYFGTRSPATRRRPASGVCRSRRVRVST